MGARALLRCGLLRDGAGQKRGSLRAHLGATWIPASGPPNGQDGMTVRVWRLTVWSSNFHYGSSALQLALDPS